jgi:hypothetical protein
LPEPADASAEELTEGSVDGEPDSTIWVRLVADYWSKIQALLDEYLDALGGGQAESALRLAVAIRDVADKALRCLSMVPLPDRSACEVALERIVEAASALELPNPADLDEVTNFVVRNYQELQ